MRYLSISLLAACVAVSGMAQAAVESSKINFVGEITDLTCKIKIDGKDGDATVTLPAMPLSKFEKTNDTAGRQDFSVSIAGCKAGKYVDSFQLGFSADQPDGDNLKNIATTEAAKNIAVQLLKVENGTGTAIKNNWSADKKDIPAAGDESKFDFAAQYIRLTDAVEPGKVEAALTVSFEYF